MYFPGLWDPVGYPTEACVSTCYAKWAPRSECFARAQLWWILYKDAVLETDCPQVEERIRAAEEAIEARPSRNGQLPADEQSALGSFLGI